MHSFITIIVLIAIQKIITKIIVKKENNQKFVIVKNFVLQFSNNLHKAKLITNKQYMIKTIIIVHFPYIYYNQDQA